MISPVVFPTNSQTQSEGEMVEWSITAVLKTAVLRGTGGSNPSLSAESSMSNIVGLFLLRSREGFQPLLSLVDIWRNILIFKY